MQIPVSEDKIKRLIFVELGLPLNRFYKSQEIKVRESSSDPRGSGASVKSSSQLLLSLFKMAATLFSKHVIGQHWIISMRLNEELFQKSSHSFSPSTQLAGPTEASYFAAAHTG